MTYVEYQGRQAFRNGADITDNPYPRYSTAGRHWVHGWREAYIKSYDMVPCPKQ